MVLSFEAQKPFIADRMAGALREVFGQEPICFRVPYHALRLGRRDVRRRRPEPCCGRRSQANPRLAAADRRAGSRADPVTCAGPPRSPPTTGRTSTSNARASRCCTYLLAGLLVAAVASGARARLELPRTGCAAGTDALALLLPGGGVHAAGSAEHQQGAVVLGNTWSVNAVIISGILAMILLANLVVARFPSLPAWLLYTGLCGACLLTTSSIFPDSLSFPMPPRPRSWAS